MSFNSGLGMERSYYVATANPFASAPKLEGEVTADVVVIGGGYTGLHAALNAVERGYSVVLLEAGRIGWGASGRNGGQIIPGWRKGASELIARYGRAQAKALFELALSARALTLDRIAKHNIQCDLHVNGHITLAAKSRDLDWMRAESDALADAMDYPHAAVITADEARAKVSAAGFHGALLDECGGQLHPLNYALGLADAARAAGVALYEHSRVTRLETNEGVVAHTGGGVVRARYGVLACDALLEGLEPRIAGRIMPVANYIVATAPLPKPEEFIADHLAVSDSRFVVNYFRMSEDGRLLFGGGERYSPDPPADIAQFVRGHMAEVFPQLRDVAIDYAWGGLVSITMSRLPHIGRLGDLFFAHGYSGQGVLLPALAGKVLVEAMGGTAERFDVLTGLAPPEFPGGAALRSPLYVLGMLWYALRDRL
ncbi:FAD-binding oxidoreductase [Terricaulis sp.]|uniref:NAD(P)/FAD-dependent oxidoreductase n=1 Tax=Terricaulis sp. TaxID=2768686 RepID=UPI002AC3B68B|nr:FAD-binding oxidoreductase [Terricaulis sp.]MDZ4692208.1 FAD-binding oxidoreductase [Terricaulis sp.]